jgi:hypothetical protein
LAIFRHSLDRHFEYLETGIPCYDLENGITCYLLTGITCFNYFFKFSGTVLWTIGHFNILKPAYPATNLFAIFQHSLDPSGTGICTIS